MEIDNNEVINNASIENRECSRLQKNDAVMAFDTELDVWFKCKILKATENFYVVYSNLRASLFDNI